MKQYNTICILGMGYIGLPTAAMFASHGKKIFGVDINARIIEQLKKGESPIQEPGLEEILTLALQSGSLEPRQQPCEADAFIIAVPTPFNADKTADMTAVKKATESIVPHLRKGNLVVLESTSPPRTTIGLVAPILEKSGLKAGTDFYLVYSPERVLPGRIMTELVENDRVIGGVDSVSAQAGKDLYTSFVRGEIILTDTVTAEMVKLMENTYRDINIAIANEFSRLAEYVNIDIWEAISIANRHPRVNILYPGPGVGGHCISVDPWFLVETAPDIAQLIRTARQVNDSQPHFVLEKTKRLVGDLNDVKVTVLGLAFKANVDDIRESPAVEITHLLHQAGAIVTAYEPNKEDVKMEGIKIAPTFEAAVKDAEAILLVVGHQMFLQMEPTQLAELTRARLVIDAVNGWSGEKWKQAGFRVIQVGNGKLENVVK